MRAIRSFLLGLVALFCCAADGRAQETPAAVPADPTSSVEEAIKVLREFNERPDEPETDGDSEGIPDDVLQQRADAEEFLTTFVACNRIDLAEDQGQCGLTIACGGLPDDKSKICEYRCPSGYVRDVYRVTGDTTGGSASVGWASSNPHSARIKLKVSCNPGGDAKIKVTHCWVVAEDLKDLVLKARLALADACQDCQ